MSEHNEKINDHSLDLKPCFSCNSKNIEIFGVIESEYLTSPYTYFAACASCGASGPKSARSGWLETTQCAADSWNTLADKFSSAAKIVNNAQFSIESHGQEGHFALYLGRSGMAHGLNLCSLFDFDKNGELTRRAIVEALNKHHRKDHHGN